MSDQKEDHKTEHEESSLRKLLDSPFIMLGISLVIVFVSYTLWGTIELFNVPPGILPK